jgi:hypothetical protein
MSEHSADEKREKPISALGPAREVQKCCLYCSSRAAREDCACEMQAPAVSASGIAKPAVTVGERIRGRVGKNVEE